MEMNNDSITNLNDYGPQVLAIASEALLVNETSNCTLFAVPDSESDWGFYPESFMASGDWMFTSDELAQSEMAPSVLDLLQCIKSLEESENVSFADLSRSIMAKTEVKIAVMKLVDDIAIQVPGLFNSIERLSDGQKDLK
jgi:hypothetical protein